MQQACMQFAWWKGICFSHKNLKKIWNHGLILKTEHRVIQFDETIRRNEY